MKATQALAAILIAAASVLRAGTINVTLQRGLNGYDGVQDTMLYSPPSVANINYGAISGLTSGINRWGEHYATLIRFDLTELPKAAKVQKATLFLYDSSKDWPNRDLPFEVQAISRANRDWVEGEGRGTRVPIQGAPCWNYRRYDSHKWAGAPGLAKAGTDYAAQPMATTTVPKGYSGWVEFQLRPEAVQLWLDDPEANAGARVYPPSAKAKGEVAYFRSSESSPDASLRPRLVIELSMTAQAHEGYRRSVALRVARRSRAKLDDARRAVAVAGSPPRAETALRSATQSLDRLEEQARQKRFDTDQSLEAFVQATEEVNGSIDSIPGIITVGVGSRANARRQLDSDFALGVADSMTNVLRIPGLFTGEFTDTAEIAMARNEFEAVQIVIVPIDKDVHDAVWAVSDLIGPGGARIPKEDVSVSVMGYQKKRKPAIHTDVEWWPGPILDFMSSVSVKRGEMQPLWVCVRTRHDTPAGRYLGTLVVDAEGVQFKAIHISATVFDFAVPKEQHLLTVWGNNESMFRKFQGERYDKAMARRHFDFLIDHRLAVNSLYSAQSAGKPTGEGWFTDCIGYPTLSDPAELKRVWDAGSRWWNLGYLHPVHAKRAGMKFEEYVPRFIEMMRASLANAEAAGWPHSNLGIYFFDETRDFRTLNNAAAMVKAAFPDIPLMTTGYDRSYGVKGGPIDKSIDIWCPLTPRFAQDLETIRKGRKLGKKAWWYVCCGPRGHKDLNFFTQFPAIRSRLLMGVATWKYGPDGFLYYRVSGWSRYKKPMDSGPLTEWAPYYLPGPDGDGQLICPGPDGPLSTIQFENIRDGIEDYEYLWVLHDAIKRARADGLPVDEEEKLLGIPEDLLSSLTAYSEDPKLLRDRRRRIAEAIVALKNRRR